MFAAASETHFVLIIYLCGIFVRHPPITTVNIGRQVFFSTE